MADRMQRPRYTSASRTSFRAKPLYGHASVTGGRLGRRGSAHNFFEQGGHPETTDTLKSRIEKLSVDIQAVCAERDTLRAQIAALKGYGDSGGTPFQPASSKDSEPDSEAKDQELGSWELGSVHIASHPLSQDFQPQLSGTHEQQILGLKSRLFPQLGPTAMDRLHSINSVESRAFESVSSRRGSVSSRRSSLRSINTVLDKEWTPVPAEPLPSAPTTCILQPGPDARELTLESTMLSSIFDSGDQEPEVFPEWILKEQEPDNTAARAEKHDDERLLEHVSEEAVVADRCVLSPTSWVRILWDIVIFLSLLFEFWATPFIACFLPDHGTPLALKKADDGITIVFACDIILNFFTGFVLNDVLVLQHLPIIRNYLSSWFWIDLLSTIPFDEIVVAYTRSRGVKASSGTNALTLIRWAKLSRILRTLRYLRMIRAVQTLRSMRQDLELMRHLRQVMSPLLMLSALVGVAHIHACIFAAIQSRWHPSPDPILSMQRYYESFWLVYLGLTTGRSIDANTMGLWTFDIVLATERVVVVSLLALWISFKAMLMLDDESRQSLMKDGALRYLQNHSVSIDTQVQVLHYLTETQQTKNKKRHLVRFMSDDVPLELYRTICEELWGDKLMSLGVILQVVRWNNDFLVEMAMLVSEDFFASKSYMFKEGDASLVAYNIISGAVMLWSTLSDRRLPDFTENMWVGEKALVNPMLRRSVTCCTRSTTVVMSVPAAEFQQLLSTFDLKDQFIEWCENTLWRGVCGRCGLVGYHFAQECTAVRHDKERRGASVSFTQQAENSEPESTRFGIQRELMEFLRMHRLRRLVPNLQSRGLTRLDDLESGDIQPLLDELKPALRSRAAASLALIKNFKEDHDHLMRMKTVANLNQMINKHLFFLSHYKVEAGTEAALMRSDLEQLISENPSVLENTHYDVPIFLDSEDLEDVSLLQQRVKNSKYLALLLTTKVLTRPWCLVEISTAVKNNIPVILVEVMKKGTEFQFPDEAFFEGLREGWILDAAGKELLSECDVNLSELEAALRKIFKRISVPYSPHRPANIRKAELQTLFKETQNSNTHAGHAGTSSSSRSTRRDSGMDRRISLTSQDDNIDFGALARARSRGSRSMGMDSRSTSRSTFRH